MFFSALIVAICRAFIAIQTGDLDDDARVLDYKLGLIKDGHYRLIADWIVDSAISVEGIDSAEIQDLRRLRRDADLDFKRIDELASRYLPQSIATHVWQAAALTGDQMIAERLRPLLSNEVKEKIAERLFQHSFSKEAICDFEFREMLKLTEEQTSRIDAFTLANGVTREKVNELIRNGRQVVVPAFARDVPGRPSPENRTSVRIYRELTEEQQEIVRRIAGEPIEDGWLEYVLEAEDSGNESATERTPERP